MSVEDSGAHGNVAFRETNLVEKKRFTEYDTRRGYKNLSSDYPFKFKSTI